MIARAKAARYDAFVRLASTIILALTAAVSAAGCTFGGYDGNLGPWDGSYDNDGGPFGDGGTTSAPVDPAIGGMLTSADGFFDIRFPRGGLTAMTKVSITQTPASCPSKVNCQSYGTAYAVSLGGASLSRSALLHFSIDRSGANVQAVSAVMFSEKSQRALPGMHSVGAIPSDVWAVESDRSGSQLGPYAILNAGFEPSNDCASEGGMTDVCGACAHGVSVCMAATFSPPASAGLGHACECAGSGNAIDSLASCIDMGEPEVCP